MDDLTNIVEWMNKNSGFLSFLLFIAAIIIGWISGLFKSLVKKPKFKVRVVDKMTFYTIYPTGKQYKPPHLDETLDLYKIAFAIYMEVSNIGSAPSTLGKVRVGYFPNNVKRHRFPKRNWIPQTSCLGDFSIPTKDGKCMVLNHLFQRTALMPLNTDSYLEVGKSIIGVGYFEQADSWGNFHPREEPDGLYDLKIEISDMWGKRHFHKTRIKKISLEDALRYNPKFGQTFELIDNKS